MERTKKLLSTLTDEDRNLYCKLNKDERKFANRLKKHELSYFLHCQKSNRDLCLKINTIVYDENHNTIIYNTIIYNKLDLPNNQIFEYNTHPIAKSN